MMPTELRDTPVPVRRADGTDAWMRASTIADHAERKKVAERRVLRCRFDFGPTDPRPYLALPIGAAMVVAGPILLARGDARAGGVLLGVGGAFVALPAVLVGLACSDRPKEIAPPASPQRGARR
jgi:hypothetical protein